jgi:hypothetical protein
MLILMCLSTASKAEPILDASCNSIVAPEVLVCGENVDSSRHGTLLTQHTSQVDGCQQRCPFRHPSAASAQEATVTRVAEPLLQRLGRVCYIEPEGEPDGP